MSNATQKALRWLAVREYSTVELSKKLHQAGHTADETHEALSYCLANDYLNDARFAAQFCRVHIERGEGPLKITFALKQHGLEQAQIQKLFEAAQVDWVRVARRLLEKHRWRFKPQDVVKQTRFLMTRGFPAQIIRLSLKERSLYEDR